MKNILNEKDRNNIIKRILSVDERSEKLWGTMTMEQMVCHCADQIKLATGNIKVQPNSTLLQKTVLKQFVLLGMPVPKEKVKTYKELDQKYSGTNPTTLENDKEILVNLIKNYNNDYKDHQVITHPTFGGMNKNQWARLIYIHLDHHLRQFSS